MSVLFQSSNAYAVVANPSATAKVSFTFDDGLESSLTQAAPVLATYGYKGTVYATTGCINSVNTCLADEGARYMTWAQLSQLANTYGWEVGGHSVTHPLMTGISASQLETEAAQSKIDLLSHGFNPTSFATPYGDYNDKVLAAIGKYYTSHRGFADTGYNAWPYDNYILRVQQVQAGVSLDTVKGYIDTAKANNTWLILVFHDIQPTASSDPDDYEYATADLASIASYVNASGITVSTVGDSMVTSTNNLLPNYGFTHGLADGWNTQTLSNVSVDSLGNGNIDTPNESIKMTASTQDIYLFSPQVAINPNETYIIKAFLNVTNTFATGEVALYVDEYDAGGSWISGQYKDAVRASYDKELSTAYTPTSSTVASASLQVIVTANSGITAYVDNVRWFSTSAGTPPVIPVDPNTNNLLQNSEFNSGITLGWATNNTTAITLDTASNGAPTGITNSIKLTPSATNNYLFSPKVSVSSLQTYTIKSFLKINAIASGEIAYYVDEYGVGGNWISGQYKLAKKAAGTTNTSFAYTPSSNNVTSASLQIIVVANSGITAYIDAVEWLSATIPAPMVAPVNVALPVISGIAQESSVLSATSGTWNNNPSSIIYQWQSCVASVCTTIATATASTYITTATDITKTIRVSVTATNNAGNTTVYSAESALITAAPAPTPLTNLVPNGTFDNGLGDGWVSGDATNISINNAGNGSPANVTNSISIKASSTNTHLFSPHVVVDGAKTYTLTSYVRLLQITSGEVGFYIDEYDASGNWISGQYKTGIETVGSSDISFVYTPSSSNVKSASLQIILVGNSNIQGYVDDIRWFLN